MSKSEQDKDKVLAVAKVLDELNELKTTEKIFRQLLSSGLQYKCLSYGERHPLVMYIRNKSGVDCTFYSIDKYVTIGSGYMSNASKVELPNMVASFVKELSEGFHCRLMELPYVCRFLDNIVRNISYYEKDFNIAVKVAYRMSQFDIKEPFLDNGKSIIEALYNLVTDKPVIVTEKSVTVDGQTVEFPYEIKVFNKFYDKGIFKRLFYEGVPYVKYKFYETSLKNDGDSLFATSVPSDEIQNDKKDLSTQILKCGCCRFFYVIRKLDNLSSSKRSVFLCKLI